MAYFCIFVRHTWSSLHTEYHVPVFRAVRLLKRFRSSVESSSHGNRIGSRLKTTFENCAFGDHESGMSTERERVYGKQKKLRLGKIA
jgi:hypothetical protein